jgi:CBS domain-containing membrane protein
MTTFAYPAAPRPMVLRPFTAAELMTRNPVSFDQNMPIQQAFALLKHHRLEAAPLIDEQGRLAGVVTAAACAAWEEFSLRSSRHGFVPEDLDWTAVFEIASADVASVSQSASSREVIERLVERRTRRVYVVNDADMLVGVVSMADVLRHLIAGGDGRVVSRAGAARLC